MIDKKETKNLIFHYFIGALGGSIVTLTWILNIYERIRFYEFFLIVVLYGVVSAISILYETTEGRIKWN